MKNKIIIVDDEKLLANTIKEILSVLEYEIFTFYNGEDAIDYYKDNYKDIALIILDMIMPKMGGKETFFKIKKIDKDVKAIVISGYSEYGDIEEMLEMGLIAYIKKPFRSNDIIEIVKSILK